MMMSERMNRDEAISFENLSSKTSHLANSPIISPNLITKSIFDRARHNIYVTVTRFMAHDTSETNRKFYNFVSEQYQSNKSLGDDGSSQIATFALQHCKADFGIEIVRK